jgi:hypothetical protein
MTTAFDRLRKQGIVEAMGSPAARAQAHLAGILKINKPDL